MLYISHHAGLSPASNLQVACSPRTRGEKPETAAAPVAKVVVPKPASGPAPICSGVGVSTRAWRSRRAGARLPRRLGKKARSTRRDGWPDGVYLVFV
jgi:hypothetical protein